VQLGSIDPRQADFLARDPRRVAIMHAGDARPMGRADGEGEGGEGKHPSAHEFENCRHLAEEFEAMKRAAEILAQVGEGKRL
jgi:hypothetical protein